MRTPNWLYRLLRCRNTETITYMDCTGLCLARDGEHKLKSRTLRCERRLHFGDEHR